MATCHASSVDMTSLRDRVEAFLSDRSVGAVTGPRRMPRKDFAEYVADAAEDMGMRVSRPPHTVDGDPEVLLFMHWRDVDDSVVSSNPDADVLCGQDLCHQVPAVMRLNRREEGDRGGVRMEVVVERFNPWRGPLLVGALLLLVGILLAVLKGDGLVWIIALGGLLMLLYGVYAVYDGHRSGMGGVSVFGILMAVIGLVLVIVPNIVADLAMVLLAVFLVIMGLMSLFGASAGFVGAAGPRAISVLVGAIMVVLGVVALFNLEGTADLVMLAIGAVMAIMGLIQVVNALRMRRAG